MMRIGSGLDVHPFAADDRRLILAGVEVPGAPGLVGHSDADVVAHAVADALLGAMAVGDLGTRFGVDEPDTVGADSLGLLGRVVADLHRTGRRVGNLDCTLVAQRPRLAPHREPMRANLARVLEIGVDAVSVKFTTTDHLGSLGRGEGMACWATVLIEDT
jgi:2-C-methyl-D-erythritol 2,4-cyclodiphosphate synthase